MVSDTVRAAVTETRNAYSPMPGTTDELSQIDGHLDEIREANLDHHVELIGTAAAQGARIVGLGELFSAPYFAPSRHAAWKDMAEEIPTGPSVRRMCEAAAEHDIVIVAPIYELDSATGRRFNTAVVIERDGRVLGSYRKTHVPCGANETGEFHETFYYEASDGGMANPSALGDNPYFPVFATSVARVGVAICYDRHFDGVMASLARADAELIFSPAVTFGAKSRRLWPAEFTTDAVRHNVFIGASNRRGAEAPWNISFFGESFFVGPNGALANLSEHPSIVIADIALAELHTEDPSGWNLGRDRRPEIYSPRDH